MSRLAGGLLLVFFLAVPTPAAAQTRIQFDPGKSGALVKGRTTGGPSESGGMKPTTYVIRARADQHMIIGVRSPKDNARFSIYAPGTKLMDDAVNRREWVGSLPASGDYQIVIYPRDRVDTTFELDVIIGPPRKSPDAVALERLRSEGSNLAKPHTVNFDLSFESKPNADRAAAQLKREGYANVRAEQVDRSITWWVFASRTMVPDEQELATIRRRMRVLAAAEEGEYGGWHAEPVK